MQDPWVTSEFRVADMLAQRSGLPPYANDAVGLLGFDQPAMIRSLRHVEPVSSFARPSLIPTSPICSRSGWWPVP